MQLIGYVSDKGDAKMQLIPEYCYGVEVEELNRKLRQRETVIKACIHADVDNDVCNVYPDPCRKMGIERGGFIGCAFSPLEAVSHDAGRVRVGQQKTKRRNRR